MLTEKHFPKNTKLSKINRNNIKLNGKQKNNKRA